MVISSGIGRGRESKRNVYQFMIGSGENKGFVKCIRVSYIFVIIHFPFIYTGSGSLFKQ